MACQKSRLKLFRQPFIVLVGESDNARANDAQMNSGWIVGAVEQVVALMIGSGLQLPDAGLRSQQPHTWD